MIHKQLYNIYIASCESDGGIYKYTLAENDSVTFDDFISADRPMYMIKEINKMYVLLKRPFKTGDSGLMSFDIGKRGELFGPSGIISTKGMDACHLCCVEGEIYCVNYSSGNLIKMPDKTVQHFGSSVNAKRQEMPHTHFIDSFDGRYLLCTNLGTDEIYVYDKNLKQISLSKVPAGHGPRHLAYCDGYVYSANELESTLSVFEYKNGFLNYITTVSVLPKNFKGENTVAAIRIKNGLCYVSNRGHNSVSVLKISGGNAFLVDSVSCGGKSPRDFNIIGNTLICTNELSDNVTFFSLENGIPKKQDMELKIKSPLCVIGNEIKGETV